MRIISITALFLLSACVHWPSNEETLKQNLDSWMGKNINEAVDKWGPPTNTFKKSDGEILYTWHNQGNTVIVNNGYGMTSAIPTGCDITLAVSPSDTIVKWRYSGNSCKSQ